MAAAQEDDLLGPFPAHHAHVLVIPVCTAILLQAHHTPVCRPCLLNTSCLYLILPLYRAPSRVWR